MKKFATFVLAMSISTLAFAKESSLRMTCLETLDKQGVTKKTKVLYDGEMPMGILSIPSQIIGNGEYRFSFAAGEKRGGKLQMIQPEGGFTPSSCIEIEPAPAFIRPSGPGIDLLTDDRAHFVLNTYDKREKLVGSIGLTLEGSESMTVRNWYKKNYHGKETVYIDCEVTYFAGN